MSPSPDRSASPPACGLMASTLRGALGFAVVSVAAFSVWAFAGGWFRNHGGEGALYAAIAAVFALLSGLLLHPLVPGPRALARFYGVFTPAFLAYSIVWSGFWFWLKSGPGEWLGAAAGSGVFVAVAAWRLGHTRGFWTATTVFFVLHTAGYFAGGQSMDWLVGVAKSAATPGDRSRWLALAKLSWGVFYGLGFGAALGFALATLRPSQDLPFPAPVK